MDRLARWLARRPTTELFLDYDGTMTPIVARPELAVMGDEARRILELAGRSPELNVVVVSGRALADVRTRVGIPDLTYVGEHGYEIDGPGISAHNGPPDAAARLDQAERELAALGVEGALIERKQVTIAFHVRGVAPRERAAALEGAALVMRRCRLLPLMGKEVLEGRPPPVWDKGHAVLWVLQHRHGADWPTRVRALYCGDDVTDEFAFRSLAGIGRSIRVGPATRGDSTAADLFLPGPEDVMQFVRRLATAGTQ
jgi:trehalose-phosphatase